MALCHITEPANDDAPNCFNDDHLLNRDFQFPPRVDEQQRLVSAPLLRGNDGGGGGEEPVELRKRRSSVGRLVSKLTNKDDGKSAAGSEKQEPRKSFLRRKASRMGDCLNRKGF